MIGSTYQSRHFLCTVHYQYLHDWRSASEQYLHSTLKHHMMVEFPEFYRSKLFNAKLYTHAHCTLHVNYFALGQSRCLYALYFAADASVCSQSVSQAVWGLL